MKYDKKYFQGLAEEFNKDYEQKSSAYEPDIWLEIEGTDKSVITTVKFTIYFNERYERRFMIHTDSFEDFTEEELINKYMSYVGKCIEAIYNNIANRVNKIINKVFIEIN